MSNDDVISADTTEFWIRERCFVRELINTSSIPDFSLAETRVEPGVTTELHKLSVNEWYAISTGSGAIEVGEEAPQAVGPGDIVAIPAGVSQRITNTGETDLVFQCVCLPRFTPSAYESLETN
jgi:mannose-6-phosphate isomerase-like protein (cupin superfamily)